MCNIELVKLISEYQQHDMINFDTLYGTFNKLLLLYGNKLGTSDTAQDLVDFFIELLFKIDLSKFKKDQSDSLKRYIAVCIRNEYYSILKKSHEPIYLTDELLDILTTDIPSFEETVFLKECLSVVSNTQRTILILRYCNDFSDSEIAEMLHISRQAVNKNRRKGLEAIKTFLSS